MLTSVLFQRVFNAQFENDSSQHINGFLHQLIFRRRLDTIDWLMSFLQQAYCTIFLPRDANGIFWVLQNSFLQRVFLAHSYVLTISTNYWCLASRYSYKMQQFFFAASLSCIIFFTQTYNYKWHILSVAKLFFAACNYW